MGYTDPVVAGSIGALIIGVSLFIGGLYARPRSRPQTRQGAEILANFGAFVGVVAMITGALFLVVLFKLKPTH